MTRSEITTAERRLDTRVLFTGGALIGVGGVIGLAGIALSGAALARAARRWMRQLETPPRELARQNWMRTKAATAAGVSAWQNGEPAQPVRSS